MLGLSLSLALSTLSYLSRWRRDKSERAFEEPNENEERKKERKEKNILTASMIDSLQISVYGCPWILKTSIVAIIVAM